MSAAAVWTMFFLGVANAWLIVSFFAPEQYQPPIRGTAFIWMFGAGVTSLFAVAS